VLFPGPKALGREVSAGSFGVPPLFSGGLFVYFTDRGIEELAERRGEEQVSLEWLAERLRDFIDLNPEFETPIERFATWLARLDDAD
jgi:hypothetical protein